MGQCVFQSGRLFQGLFPPDGCELNGISRQKPRKVPQAREADRGNPQVAAGLRPIRSDNEGYARRGELDCSISHGLWGYFPSTGNFLVTLAANTPPVRCRQDS